MEDIQENTLYINHTALGMGSKIVNGKLNVYQKLGGIETEYKDHINTNNKKYDIRAKYGIYWNEFDEIGSIGEDITRKLLENGTIKGDTYIQMMSAEYGIKIEFLESTYHGPMSACEYKILEGEELEKKKKDYFGYIDDDIKNNFNNIIFVIKDEPKYSNSKQNHSTTNIVIISKDTSYLIKVAYQNYKEFDTNPDQIVKQLKIKKR